MYLYSIVSEIEHLMLIFLASEYFIQWLWIVDVYFNNIALTASFHLVFSFLSCSTKIHISDSYIWCVIFVKIDLPTKLFIFVNLAENAGRVTLELCESKYLRVVKIDRNCLKQLFHFFFLLYSNSNDLLFLVTFCC